jgi:CDP-diacylglycerol--glycerol-3-phosphate 3-phosphatidyltransferase/cardiolipin synthase
MRSGISATVRGVGLGSLAHLLTGVRLGSAPFIYAWIVEGSIELAAAAIGAAMLTDLVDGPLIRRFGRPSKAGAWFDVWADFLVIVSAFAGFAAVGILSFWPLVPIGASYALFIATAGLGPAMYDPIGRYIGGILMLGALGVLLAHDIVMQQAVALTVVIACLMTMVVRITYALPWGRARAA